MQRGSLEAMTATRRRPTPKARGRFGPDAVADRIDALRKLAEVPPKEIASAIWPSQTPENAARSWYKRVNQRTQNFSLAELEVAVDYLLAEARRKGALTAAVLPGFPFIDLFVSIQLERGGRG